MLANVKSEDTMGHVPRRIATLCACIYLLILLVTAQDDFLSNIFQQCEPLPPTAAGTAGIELLGSQINIPIEQGMLVAFRFGNTTSIRSPIVLINGFTSTVSHIPLPLIQQLAAEQEVIIFDNRGIGLSTDHSNNPLTIEQMAVDTVDLIEALQLPRPPTIIGISMGGMVGLQIVAFHRDIIHKAIIVSSTAGGPSAVPPLQEIREAFIFGDISGVLGSIFNLATTQGINALCSSLANERNMPSSPGNNTTEERQSEAISAWFQQTGVANLLPEFTTPILRFHGAQDQIVPYENSKVMASRLPHPWLVTFPQGLHGAYIEHLDTFIRVVDAFLVFSPSGDGDGDGDGDGLLPDLELPNLGLG